MVKQGKGELFRQTTERIRSQLSSELWRAYCAPTLTWKEYRECVDYMREVLSWDNLIGVKQLSIYDLLDDEKLVSNLTNEDV